MKVAILSMQDVDNYGSVLQAYALKHLLEAYGADVDFIKIKKIEDDYKLVGGVVETYSKEYDKPRRHSKIPKADRFFFNRVINLFRSKFKHRRYEEFRRQFLGTTAANSHYDLCVIGSDEVFNCLNTQYWGFTSQLFGNVPEADSVITYAASCGSTRYEKIPEAVREKIGQAFERISAFSVRDENTYRFVSQLTEKNICVNLDPVVIYDFDSVVNQTKLPRLPKRYCVVYSYDNRIYKNEEITAIKRICRQYKMTPIAVGGSQFWCRKSIVCSPFECLKIFQNATFVITDTFHGTIFSAKYADAFAVILRESNNNKLSDLISRLGISKHLNESLSDIVNIEDYRKDAKQISAIITEARNNTRDYFNKEFC